MPNMDPALTVPFDENAFTSACQARDEARTKMEDARARLVEMQTDIDSNDGAEFSQKDFDNQTVLYTTARQEWKDLDADVEKMSLKSEAITIEKREANHDGYMLTDQLFRAGSMEEYNEFLASPEFAGLTGENDSPEVPNGSLELALPTAAEANRRAAMTAGIISPDNATGQEAVQTDVAKDVISRLDWFGGIMQVARKINSSNGNPMKFPIVDNITQKASRVAARGTNAPQRQPNDIDSVEIGSETITSGIIGVSLEAIADLSFDVVGYVMGEMIRRHGRYKNEVFTDGVSNTDFVGLLQVAGPGITAASQTDLDIEEFSELIYSVNRAYRTGMESPMGEGGLNDKNRGRIAFMFPDVVEQMLQGLSDNEGRPLWNVSVREGLPNTIWGKPYVINDDLPSPAAGATPIVFGNFGHFAVRRIGGVNMQNFYDSYTARANERHFMSWERCASQLIGPVDSNDKADAIKLLTMRA